MMEEDERLKKRWGCPVRGCWAWRNEAADGEEENGKGLGIMCLAHGVLSEKKWAVMWGKGEAWAEREKRSSKQAGSDGLGKLGQTRK